MTMIAEYRSPVMATFPYEWKILEWDKNPVLENEKKKTKQTYLWFSDNDAFMIKICPVILQKKMKSWKG